VQGGARVQGQEDTQEQGILNQMNGKATTTLLAEIKRQVALRREIRTWDSLAELNGLNRTTVMSYVKLVKTGERYRSATQNLKKK
jgi:hypothetical protein